MGFFSNDVDQAEKTGHTDFEQTTVEDVNAFLGGLDLGFLGGGSGGSSSGGGGSSSGGGSKSGGGGKGTKGPQDILSDEEALGENSIINDPEIAQGLEDYITTTLTEDPSKIYELDPALAEEAESLRAQMIEAGQNLADLDPETAAAFEQEIAHEIAMSQRGFEVMKDDFLVRMFGSGTEQSTMAGDIGGRLVGDQALTEAGIRSQGAMRKLGARQFLTQTGLQSLGMAQEGLNAQRMAELQRMGLISQDRMGQMQLAGTTFGALSDAQSRLAQARLNADAELKSSWEQAQATIKAAKAQASAMVRSSKISAAADKYATRATLASQMYGYSQADKQFGYELDYKYYSAENQFKIAEMQQPTGFDRAMQAVSAASGMTQAVMSGGTKNAAGSDERLKDNIVRLPVEVLPGVPLAHWTWKDSGNFAHGVIAQDLQKVLPEAVIDNNGVLFVDYGRLFEEANNGTV
jgi:hypothetical protein